MKRIRKIMGMLVLAAVIMGMAGCGSRLAGDFEEEKVKQQAMDDVTMGEAGDYEAWKARFEAGLQASLTEEIYTNYLSILEEKGAFQEFGKCAVAGQSKDGKNYAVVVLVAKHEKGDLQYTVVYDEDMKLINYTI